MTITADPIEAFRRKIDFFFEIHVLPQFAPERIEWWFSLSGGKDSFAMAEGIRDWYQVRGIPLSARGIAIDQWGGAAARSISSQMGWLSVHLVDGAALTKELTQYVPGQQAPCRPCADARRNIGDAFLESHPARAGSVSFLARGLHMTDTAVSLAWRFAAGRDPAAEMIALGKARPRVALRRDVFLAKPLTYVREFESERFASEHGYIPSCCGCPACKFPSRRDIVEESIARFYEGPLWEFQVPGLADLIKAFGGQNVQAASAPGAQSKHKHLPPDLGAFAVGHFKARLEANRRVIDEECDPAIDLDQVGAARLQGAPLFDSERTPLPALLAGRKLDAREEIMIATMGPFWGALGLAPAAASRALDLQRRLLGFSCDDRWSQVNSVLANYYSLRENRVTTLLPIYPSASSCGKPQV